jgi:hypothetical protein
MANASSRSLGAGADAQQRTRGDLSPQGRARLPIEELLGSRPVDALLHEGEAEAVAARGGQSFADTFARLLPLELGKASGSGA